MGALPLAAAAAGRYEVEDEPSTALQTGKYDMKMLSRLGKMEQQFRVELATLWEVEDEDRLPDDLQELDFNDILASGGTEAVRTGWLLRRVCGAEGYVESKRRTVAGLVEKTIQSIMELEKDYAK